MRLDRDMFRIDGRGVSVGEVLATGRIAGILKGLERNLAEALACEELAGEEGVEVSPDEIQSAVNAWRTEKDLISAAETESWLETQGLDIEDLAGHLEGKLLRERLAPRLAEALARHAPEPEDVDARRAVAPPATDATALAAERARLLADRGLASPEDVSELIAPFGLTPGAAARLLGQEASYRLAVSAIASDAALAREIDRNRTDLARLELGVAAVASEDAARELILCIRQDGETMEDLARRVPAVTFTLERPLARSIANGPLRARLLGGRRGDLFGPIPDGDRFIVYQLRSRRDPELADPEIRALVERAVVERTLSTDILRRVRFARIERGR
jgi:hypothetical protein